MKILQVEWIEPSEIEEWLGKMAIGRTLNVCCGMSKVGEVRIDILPPPRSSRTQDGNVFNLPFLHGEFDTVICDPPFSYYSHFLWIRKLGDIALKRLLLSGPQIPIRIPGFQRKLFAFDVPGKLYLRLWWCFDRADGLLEFG